MKILANVSCLFIFLLFQTATIHAQKPISFGTVVNLNKITTSEGGKEIPLKWIDVNTSAETWTVKNDLLMSTCHPICVMRSEKQFENYILHIEWNHLEAV
jgi:hypothetical protein